MARGRKAMTLEEKIENAKTADLSKAQSDFISWLKNKTGLKIDDRSVVLAQKLYAEFLETPEAASAIAERKAEAAARTAEREEKAKNAFLARAAKLGFTVAKVEDEDAE